MNDREPAAPPLSRRLSTRRRAPQPVCTGQTVLVSVIPHSVFEAAVRVAGETLYWKRSLKRLLRTAGVSEGAIVQYEHLTKYQILREVWARLDSAGPRGLKVQKAIVGALANLDAPEPQADERAGREALDDLRRLSQAHGLLVDPDERARENRRQEAVQRAGERDTRAQRLAALRASFRDLHSQTNPQARGYAFEKLLADLFRTYELDFDGSYKTEVDQVDGALKFEAFTYLLEARWRSAPAVESDLVQLAGKVRRRIESTRGLFVSMAGFRPEVVELYKLSHDQRLVLVDGQDLALIFESRIELPDALRAKVHAASVDGQPFLPLASMI